MCVFVRVCACLLFIHWKFARILFWKGNRGCMEHYSCYASCHFTAFFFCLFMWDDLFLSCYKRLLCFYLTQRNREAAERPPFALFNDSSCLFFPTFQCSLFFWSPSRSLCFLWKAAQYFVFFFFFFSRSEWLQNCSAIRNCEFLNKTFFFFVFDSVFPVSFVSVGIMLHLWKEQGSDTFSEGQIIL